MEPSKKIKKSVTKTITIVENYNLSKTVSYKRTYVNDKLKSNVLHYKGKKHNGYDLHPLWKPDLEVLKKHNPYWGESKEFKIDGYDWFNQKELPEPSEINLDDIILCQGSTHSFFDLNLDPIPVVVHGDYIDANLNSKNYNLEELKEYFDSHPNVVRCSEILEIPYYNASKTNGKKFLDVLVYPELEWLKDICSKKLDNRFIFTQIWDHKNPDYLKIRSFLKQK